MTVRAECISYKGQLYEACDEARGLIRDLEWAESITTKPDCEALNGRSMHEIAWEAHEKAHDALIDFARFRA